MNNINKEIAHRQIYWNLESITNQYIMYLLLTIAVIIFAYGFWARIKLWATGRPDRNRFGNFLSRLIIFIKEGFGQNKVNRERFPGFFHSLIVIGFFVLLFTTTMVFIDYDLGIKIYQGNFYLIVTVLSDVYGLGLVIGLLVAAHRRMVYKSDALNLSFADFILLGSLGLLCIQGYILEGIRIKVTQDPWAYFSPVGYLTSLGFWSFSEPSLRLLHFLTWWVHAVTVFACIAVIPYTKFFHIFVSSINLFFQDLYSPRGQIKSGGDLEKIFEEISKDDSQELKLGISSLEDLTWKQRLDLDACTSCGRCQEVCPAYNSGKVLSPKWLILDTRNHMLGLVADGKDNHNDNQNKLGTSSAETPSSSNPSKNIFKVLDKTLLGLFLKSSGLKRIYDSNKSFKSWDYRDKSKKAANPLVQNSALQLAANPLAELAGEVMEKDVFWSCTTCRACEEACPVGIDHLDYIFGVRQNLALIKAEIPHEAQASLRAIETRDNPFGAKDDRVNWAEGQDIKFVNSGDEVDYLYWVGCISAYDRRKQDIAKSVVKILNKANLSWGTLGPQECCTGDPARRLGEENLFQIQAKKNSSVLNSIKFKYLVANCPHCFNTLKNEYSEFGLKEGSFEVIHHSELIQNLLKEGKITPKKLLDEKVTFHDPCYLGRYNEQYDAPREVLVQISANKHLEEMKSNRQKGMCCGAGGGHFWMDMKVGDRVNVMRSEQALATGAKVVATGCPFCLHMMEDGLKLLDKEDKMVVKDIAEIVAESL